MVGERILIIEDDERIASMLRRGLIFEGFEASAVHDGRAGLEAARERVPDLVVLDLMLPEIDGMEVCRRLRAAGDVPILMLTEALTSISGKRSFTVRAMAGEVVVTTSGPPVVSPRCSMIETTSLAR